MPNSPAVIFITAYDEYVFETLDLFPFHYLLKPLDEVKFEKILKRAAERYEKKEKEEAVFFIQNPPFAYLSQGYLLCGE